MNVIAATEFLAVNATGGTAVGWIGYIIIGGIAGWLASKIVRGGGSGILMDIVVGIVGAFITGLILNQLGYDVDSGGYWFTFLIAFAGAVVLLLIIRLVRR
jgi:uncharacterized membrane protein YeaQ/YmgE (transglycosylase-associated protein family)